MMSDSTGKIKSLVVALASRCNDPDVLTDCLLSLLPACFPLQKNGQLEKQPVNKNKGRLDSKQKKQIRDLKLKGWSVRSISTELGISIPTIKKYSKGIG